MRLDSMNEKLWYISVTSLFSSIIAQIFWRWFTLEFLHRVVIKYAERNASVIRVTELLRKGAWNNLVTLQLGTVRSSTKSKHRVTRLCTIPYAQLMHSCSVTFENVMSYFWLSISSTFSIHTSQLGNSRRCMTITDTYFFLAGKVPLT
jgi:hypothetical protein